MKSITINGSQRESVGKVATKTLRNAEKVPCVLYGGDKTIHFSAEEKAFKKLVYTPDVYTVKLDIEGLGSFNAILQNIQFHPVTDRILHIDFYQIFDEKQLTMEIPVKLVGNSVGVIKGGALRHNMRKLKVRTIPANLPDYIEADISKLEIGSKLYITELANGNYTFMHPDNTVVAQVRMARTASTIDEVVGEETEEVEESAAEA